MPFEELNSIEEMHKNIKQSEHRYQGSWRVDTKR